MNVAAALAPIMGDLKTVIDITRGIAPCWRSPAHTSVIERFAVVVIEGERDFCGEDPNPHVVSLTCALANLYAWSAPLVEDWAPLARVAHQLGVDKTATPDLVARVIVDALDEAILLLTCAELDDVLSLSRFALECSPELGRRLMAHVERWLDSPEEERGQ